MKKTNQLAKIAPLTPEAIQEKYQVVDIKTTKEEIQNLLDFKARVDSVVAFQAGKRLLAVKNMLNHGEFLFWIDHNFKLTERSSQRYMALYEYYKDKPASFLESKSLTELYTKAGITKAPELLLEAPEDEDDWLENPISKEELSKLPPEELASQISAMQIKMRQSYMEQGFAIYAIGEKLERCKKDLGSIESLYKIAPQKLEVKNKEEIDFYLNVYNKYKGSPEKIGIWLIDNEDKILKSWLEHTPAV